MNLKNMMTEERYNKMESVISQRSQYFSLILENLYDPHNISAIIRTAEAYGIHHVHVIDDQNPFKVSKTVSMGADKWVNIDRYKNTLSCMDQIKQKGYKIYIADPNEKYPTIEDLDLSQPFAILMGQEKWGVSDMAKKEADGCFRIPLFGFVESFNVSVACAILIAQFMYKLRSAPPKNFFLDKEEQQKLLQQWMQRDVF